MVQSSETSKVPERVYPPMVRLLARSSGSPDSVPIGQCRHEIERWLLDEGGRVPTLHALFEAFCWRLVVAGIPLHRASLHVGTLHPQLLGFAWNWSEADGFCDEVQVSEEALQHPAFLRSPLSVVFRTGQELVLDPRDEATVAQYGLMADLRQAGFTQYVALPLGAGDYHNVATVATRHPDGYSPEQHEILRSLLRLLALHVERHIAVRISQNVVETYLGVDAGKAVLDGVIKRGKGSRIEAVIWVSDLRGFTDLSDRLAPDDMLLILNAYFSQMVGAVTRAGGDVLKFVGDGLLAVFPLDRTYPGTSAAGAALAAALEAEAAVASLGTTPPDELADIKGWAPLRSGIGLHVGDVFFGNVGAPNRLDFTVIGSAVNTASRVEGLTKPLASPIILTAPVADAITIPVESLGRHSLRGLPEPIELFEPARPHNS
ncbi:adenylate/guanylate cyclase domain-containing protein [Pannonibacter sp.]|uniref:adenylate/guanylate cyclase domain-containing protein n=1 Tax=Pannonibacter sp. TaxID=1906786 RepID=UPI003F6F9BFF